MLHSGYMAILNFAILNFLIPKCCIIFSHSFPIHPFLWWGNSLYFGWTIMRFINFITRFWGSQVKHLHTFWPVSHGFQSVLLLLSGVGRILGQGPLQCIGTPSPLREDKQEYWESDEILCYLRVTVGVAGDTEPPTGTAILMTWCTSIRPSWPDLVAWNVLSWHRVESVDFSIWWRGHRKSFVKLENSKWNGPRTGLKNIQLHKEPSHRRPYYLVRVGLIWEVWHPSVVSLGLI